MEQVIEFVKSMSLSQWAGVALLAAAAWFGRGHIASAFSYVRGQVAPPKPDDSADEAFHAVNTLIAHFERTKCTAGLAAAREAGKHLFDQPGEHS